MILYRYLVKELLFPFFLTLGVISSILLMDQIYKFLPFLQAMGLKLGYLGEMILYSLPANFMIAAPISLMVGIYYGVHRLCMDHEVVAMRAAGVSLAFLFRPVLFLSAILALITGLAAFYLAPWGVTSMEKLQYQIIKKQTNVSLSVQNVNNFFGQQMIYLFDKEGDLFKGVIIAPWEAPLEGPIIQANSGRIAFDEERQRIQFLLFDGEIHYPGQPAYRIVKYQSMDYDLMPPERDEESLSGDLKNLVAKKGKKDIEMLPQELWYWAEHDPKEQLRREYKDEFHSRFVSAFSCIALAILALPLGVDDPRSPTAKGFIYLFLSLMLFFAFYAKSRSGYVNGQFPLILIYAPLVAATGLGLQLFRNLNRF